VEDRDDMLADAGPRRARRERLCIVTRTVRPVDDLIRFVLGPGGIVPDLKRRLPGRGVWVTGTAEAVRAAVARNAFARGLKQAARAPADLPAVTDRVLEAAVLDALAIAHKAGLVRTGFTKVEAALAQENVAALLHAAEAAPDGARKLAAAARRGGRDNVKTITLFTGPQLDLAFGRLNVVHAAMLAGPASETVLTRWHSLEVFRGG
jgi:predicted RNA-binding protein YlxR (DUF448 family)